MAHGCARGSSARTGTDQRRLRFVAIFRARLFGIFFESAAVFAACFRVMPLRPPFAIDSTPTWYISDQTVVPLLPEVLPASGVSATGHGQTITPPAYTRPGVSDAAATASGSYSIALRGRHATSSGTSSSA